MFSSERMKRSLVILVALAIAAVIAFVLPKPKYKSLNVLKDVSIPMVVGDWQGKDVEHHIQLLDDAYNFVNALFLREYVHPSGQRLYLYLLDAGNFHNPKTCFTMSGYELRELEDITFRLPADAEPFKAPSAFLTQGRTSLLTTYWITINGKRVNWTEQKVKEFLFSLIGARKAGLMVRIDTPATESQIKLVELGLEDFIAILSVALSDQDRAYVFGR